LLSLVRGSPFLAFLVGLFTVAGAVVLWIELLAREAAVYVVVLMLPLAFAALVWPARRVWAVRAVELLVALILSKFAIVAVLALGGAALGHSAGGGLGAMLAGLVLVVMGTFAPWAMLRLLPLAELASGAVGSLRTESRGARATAQAVDDTADHWAQAVTARMRRDADAEDLGADHGTAASGIVERLSEDARVQARGAEPPDARESAPGSAADAPDASGAAAAGGGSSATANARTDTGTDTGTDIDTDTDTDTCTERNPGMDPIWQAANREWPTITLGFDDDGLPPTAEAPDDRPADDHDPRPPRQGPEDRQL
jgi:hypothetical protein